MTEDFFISLYEELGTSTAEIPESRQLKLISQADTEALFEERLSIDMIDLLGFWMTNFHLMNTEMPKEYLRNISQYVEELECDEAVANFVAGIQDLELIIVDHLTFNPTLEEDEEETYNEGDLKMIGKIKRWCPGLFGEVQGLPESSGDEEEEKKEKPKKGKKKKRNKRNKKGHRKEKQPEKPTVTHTFAPWKCLDQPALDHHHPWLPALLDEIKEFSREDLSTLIPHILKNCDKGDLLSVTGVLFPRYISLFGKGRIISQSAKDQISRKLMSKLHPDQNPDPRCNELFLFLKE